MATNRDCTDDSLVSDDSDGGQQQYSFYLAGVKMPEYTDQEFAVDTSTPAKVVPCQRKGKVEFGQPNGRPTITKDNWTTTPTEDALDSTARSGDQPDTVEPQTGVLHVAKYGWKVNRNKVCIQADTLLMCGIPLDRKAWGDKFRFAFFQTVASSSTNFTYKDDADHPRTVYKIAHELKPDFKYPLLDVNATQGHNYLPPDKRPWAPYYSDASYISLAGIMKTIEAEPDQRSLSGRISMGDSPYVLVPQSVQHSAFPLDLQHSQSATLEAVNNICFLSTAEHQSKYHSWIVVYDESKNTVWPLAMFEWEFAFSAHIEGTELVFDSDTPQNPAKPTVYLNEDSRALQIPEFPIQVLKKVGECYVAADDSSIYHWVPVTS